MADFRRPHIASGNGVDRRRMMKAADNDSAADCHGSPTQHRVRLRYVSADSVDDGTSQRRHDVDER